MKLTIRDRLKSRFCQTLLVKTMIRRRLNLSIQKLEIFSYLHLVKSSDLEIAFGIRHDDLSHRLARERVDNRRRDPHIAAV